MTFKEARRELEVLGFEIGENMHGDGSPSTVDISINMDLSRYNKYIQQFGMGMKVVYPNKEVALKYMLRLIKEVKEFKDE